MFGTVTALIPTGTALSGLGSISGQLTADAPELFGILFGVTAIAFVIGLSVRFLRHLRAR